MVFTIYFYYCLFLLLLVINYFSMPTCYRYILYSYVGTEYYQAIIMMMVIIIILPLHYLLLFTFIIVIDTLLN